THTQIRDTVEGDGKTAFVASLVAHSLPVPLSSSLSPSRSIPHTHTHTHTHTCTHVDTHIHAHMQTHTHTHTHNAGSHLQSLIYWIQFVAFLYLYKSHINDNPLIHSIHIVPHF